MRRPRPDSWKKEVAWLALVAVLACVWGGTWFLKGREYLIDGSIWVENAFFGFDVRRVIEVLTLPEVTERSNAHPLFGVMVRPAVTLIRWAGASPGIAVLALNMLTGAGLLVLTAIYYRRAGVGRLDSTLGAALMAASGSWCLGTALPNTFIYSALLMALTGLMGDWTLVAAASPKEPSPMARRTRNVCWWVLGVAQYGVTVTNVAMAWLMRWATAEGSRVKKATRGALYGVGVVAIGVVLSLLAESSLNVLAERQWVSDPQVKGGTLEHPVIDSVSTTLAWGVVPPRPEFNPMPDKPIHVAAFLGWNYSTLGWVLTTGWLALLAGGAWQSWRTRKGWHGPIRRAQLGFIVVHMVLHSFYYVTYEGMTQYHLHALFALFAVCAPLLARMEEWPAGRRWAMRGGVMLWVVMMAFYNHEVLQQVHAYIAGQ